MQLELESRPVIVLAHARTGTHLLRGILSSSDEIDDFGEIFLPGDWPHRTGGFWEFYRDWLPADPGRAVPTPENRRLLFTDYLTNLDRLCSAPFMLLDVKYGGIANLNPFYHLPDQRPYLFKLFERYEIPVIHLMRRNLLQQHCSRILADETERWVVPVGADAPAPVEQSIVVDVDLLVGKLTRMALRVQFFDGYLSGYHRYLRLHYEDLLENGVLSDQTRQSIGQLLNRLISVDGTPQTRKVTPPLSSFVANYDAVEKTLKDTPFAAMLEDGALAAAPAIAGGDVAMFGHPAGQDS